MAGKPRLRRKQVRQDKEKLGQPTRWRLQHGDVGPAVRENDPDGRVASHRRVLDTLDRMERTGTISGAMRDAGHDFHRHFRAAALDALRAASLLRVPGGSGESLTERHVAARRRVAGAIAALGGSDSAAGSCVWHVVGCERSIREWAARQGWAGRTMGHSQAQGVLVAALGVLARVYGHEPEATGGQLKCAGRARGECPRRGNT